jgi:hypothetical protein
MPGLDYVIAALARMGIHQVEHELVTDADLNKAVQLKAGEFKTKGDPTGPVKIKATKERAFNGKQVETKIRLTWTGHLDQGLINTPTTRELLTKGQGSDSDLREALRINAAQLIIALHVRSRP